MITQRRPRLTAYALLLAVVLVWGATFALVKSALNTTTPLVFNLLRMSLAALLLLAVNHRSLRHLTRRDIALGAAAGILLALGYQFQTTGLAYTTASKSAFLTGLVVVFVPLLSSVPGVATSTAAKARPTTFLGAILAFIGLILLTTPPGSGTAIPSLGSMIFSGLHLGEWLSLACAFAFAAHLLMLSHAAPLVSARKLGTLQIAFAALTMLITLPLGGPIYLHPAPALWIALGVTAILATAAAFTIQSWAQRHLPATHTALIFTLEPVFAWLTALLFFHERLGPRALTGAALILAGILLAELMPPGRGSGSAGDAPLLPTA